jgi:hypothetical protein
MENIPYCNFTYNRLPVEEPLGSKSEEDIKKEAHPFLYSTPLST